MNLQDLDDATRAVMLAELEQDERDGRIYISHRLNGSGARRWPELLTQAFETGDPTTLAAALRSESVLIENEQAHRSGRPYQKKVPVNAPETLAEGEFLRYYMRALCVRASKAGSKVQVYRAKHVVNPRPESVMKIGQLVDPGELLQDLRRNVGLETMLGLPPGPNSGLCVRLV